jgi:hypothetical protein
MHLQITKHMLQLLATSSARMLRLLTVSSAQLRRRTGSSRACLPLQLPFLRLTLQEVAPQLCKRLLACWCRTIKLRAQTRCARRSSKRTRWYPQRSNARPSSWSCEASLLLLFYCSTFSIVIGQMVARKRPNIPSDQASSWAISCRTWNFFGSLLSMAKNCRR